MGVPSARWSGHRKALVMTLMALAFMGGLAFVYKPAQLQNADPTEVTELRFYGFRCPWGIVCRSSQANNYMAAHAQVDPAIMQSILGKPKEICIENEEDENK